MREHDVETFRIFRLYQCTDINYLQLVTPTIYMVCRQTKITKDITGMTKIKIVVSEFVQYCTVA